MDNTEPRIQTAVRAFITNDDGHVLIIKRANTKFCEGWWNLPGGKIDFNQTADEAVIREIKEETQLDCTSTKFLFYMDNLPTEEYNTHFLTLFFFCECSGNVNLNRESAEFHWMNSDEMPSFQLAFSHDQAIMKFLDIHQRG